MANIVAAQAATCGRCGNGKDNFKPKSEDFSVLWVVFPRWAHSMTRDACCLQVHNPFSAVNKTLGRDINRHKAWILALKFSKSFAENKRSNNTAQSRALELESICINPPATHRPASLKKTLCRKPFVYGGHQCIPQRLVVDTAGQLKASISCTISGSSPGTPPWALSRIFEDKFRLGTKSGTLTLDISPTCPF